MFKFPLYCLFISPLYALSISRAVELGIGPNKVMRTLTKKYAAIFPDSPNSVQEIIAYFVHDTVKSAKLNTSRGEGENTTPFFKHAFEQDGFSACIFASDDVLTIMDSWWTAHIYILSIDICGQVRFLLFTYLKVSVQLCERWICWFCTFFIFRSICKYMFIFSIRLFRSYTFWWASVAPAFGVGRWLEMRVVYGRLWKGHERRISSYRPNRQYYALPIPFRAS